jgi:hypothetical protein
MNNFAKAAANIRRKSTLAKKAESTAADQKMDKKLKIKEGSPQDEAMDLKMMKKMKKG